VTERGRRFLGINLGPLKVVKDGVIEGREPSPRTPRSLKRWHRHPADDTFRLRVLSLSCYFKLIVSRPAAPPRARQPTSLCLYRVTTTEIPQVPVHNGVYVCAAHGGFVAFAHPQP
jgi:hypothetical protein